MQWYACGPEKADDHDDETDLGLFGEREGHCGCLLTPPGVPSASWVIVVGGYSDGELSGTPLATRVTVHDDSAAHPIEPLDWQELSYDEAFERDGASLTRWTCDTAVLFGGLDGSYERCATAQLVSLAIVADNHNDNNAVDVSVSGALETTGEAPSPRSRHSAGCSGDRLYIFAGETDGAEQSADLHVMDLCTRVWRRLATDAAPSPRLLSSPLVFVTEHVFVLYGGAHYVDGAIASLDDSWYFDAHTESFARLSGAETSDASAVPLPPCNGHGGAVWWSHAHHGDAARASGVVFLGGKDASEGCDAVKAIQWLPDTAMSGASLLVDVPAVRLLDGTPTHAPHWRYTPVTVPCGAHGVLMVGGNCRHPKGAAAYYLRFS